VTARSAVAAEHADSPTSIQDPFARLRSRRPRLGAGWRQRRRERGWTCHQDELTPSLRRPTGVPKPFRTPPQSLTNTANPPTLPGPRARTAREPSPPRTRSVEGVAAVEAELLAARGPSPEYLREPVSAGRSAGSWRSSRRARMTAVGADRGRGGPRLVGVQLCPERRRGHLAVNVGANVPRVIATHAFTRSPPAKTPADAGNRQRCGRWRRSHSVPVAFGATQQPTPYVPGVLRSGLAP
jgi:hypothetical protein